MFMFCFRNIWRPKKSAEKKGKKVAIFATNLVVCAEVCTFTSYAAQAGAAQIRCPFAVDKMSNGKVLALLQDGREVECEGASLSTITHDIIASDVQRANSTFYEIKSLFIPRQVTRIDKQALQYCIYLESVFFEEGSQLTHIENEAFFKCTALSTIVLPQGLKSIGANAFEETALTSINIPPTVTCIGKGAFCRSKRLRAVLFEDGSRLTHIGNCAFFGCTALSTIVLPQGLESIGANAFKGTNLTYINIPHTVTHINNGAFGRSKRLRAVLFEDGSRLTHIGNCAFLACTALSVIGLPQGGESNRTFAIGLPQGLESIGANSFADTALTSIRLPSTVTYIGKGAFCGSQVSDLRISTNVQYKNANLSPEQLRSFVIDIFTGIQPQSPGILDAIHTGRMSPRTPKTRIKFKIREGCIVTLTESTAIRRDRRGWTIVPPQESLIQ
jgi:hypothetical protein